MPVLFSKFSLHMYLLCVHAQRRTLTPQCTEYTLGVICRNVLRMQEAHIAQQSTLKNTHSLYRKVPQQTHLAYKCTENICLQLHVYRHCTTVYHKCSQHGYMEYMYSGCTLALPQCTTHSVVYSCEKCFKVHFKKTVFKMAFKKRKN